MLSSRSSLDSVHSRPDTNWKRLNGVIFAIKNNQPFVEIVLKQDVLRQFLESSDQQIQVDISFFRYTATQDFVNMRKLANGNNNDTSFYLVINNIKGVFDRNSMQTQILGVIDIVDSYVDVLGNKYYIYSYVNRIGQYGDLAVADRMQLGFAHIDRNGVPHKDAINFNTTDYYLNLFIE